MCKHCDKQHRVDKVKFVNVEEDMYGRDVMTFLCSKTKEEQKSLVTRNTSR